MGSLSERTKVYVVITGNAVLPFFTPSSCEGLVVSRLRAVTEGTGVGLQWKLLAEFDGECEFSGVLLKGIRKVVEDIDYLEGSPGPYNPLISDCVIHCAYRQGVLIGCRYVATCSQRSRGCLEEVVELSSGLVEEFSKIYSRLGLSNRQSVAFCVREGRVIKWEVRL